MTYLITYIMVRIKKPPEFYKLLLKINKEEYEKFQKYVSLANEKYLHWNDLTKNSRFKKTDLERLWAVVKMSRKLSERRVRLSRKHIIKYVQTPYIEKRLHNLDLRLGRVGYLDFPVPLNELGDKYHISALIEEAISSSQLEGAATTRIVAKEMILQQKKPRNKSERMILNNYLTIKKIVSELKEKELSLDLIKKIHKMMVRGTLKNSSKEGEFRKSNDIHVVDTGVQEIQHTPPDYRTVEALLKSLCEFINNETQEVYWHPLVKASILHYAIGYIHPFVDGNGRTARALFYWYLIKNEYPLIEYLAISRLMKASPAQYARAYLYSESDDNDATYFVVFNLKVLDKALKKFEDYLKLQQKKRAELKRLIKLHSLNMRQADLLVHLRTKSPGKIITLSWFKEKYGVSYQTARNDLFRLAKKGLLSAEKAQNKWLFSAR